MILADATWMEIDAQSRDMVVLIPTGSLEQHGPHLPLFTDSILAEAVARAAEATVPSKCILAPTVWLGASYHHLAFAGSLSASFDSYIATLNSICESVMGHGFLRIFVLNGHGGNSDPNGVAMRELKHRHPNATLVHSNYYTFAEQLGPHVLEGPAKRIQHACEAEASLMMHVRPDLVRVDKLRNDGLRPEPPIAGLVANFDEITEQGSLGYATFAKPEKGKAIFDAAVEGVVKNIEAIYNGYVFSGG